MNPTSNKSDFEDLTTNLKDLAYSYLEKYSPSKQQLKIYLLKKYLTKIKGTTSKKEVSMIIDEIVKHLPNSKVKYSSNGSDPRNYKVSFSKVNYVLGFSPKYSVKDGIKELVNALKMGLYKDSLENKNSYGNYSINYNNG